MLTTRRAQSTQTQADRWTPALDHDLDRGKGLARSFCESRLAGEMLNIHDVKAAYEKAIGHETSNSTIYNLLGRLGWRKLMPRPFHPKRDIAAQNSFKKTAFPML